MGSLSLEPWLAFHLVGSEPLSLSLGSYHLEADALSRLSRLGKKLYFGFGFVLCFQLLYFPFTEKCTWEKNDTSRESLLRNWSFQTLQMKVIKHFKSSALYMLKVKKWKYGCKCHIATLFNVWTMDNFLYISLSVTH